MPVAKTIQVYSNFDKALVDWVHSLQYDDRPLPCVFATPERAFGQMSRVLKKRLGKTPQTIPLPFASIQRVREEYDSQRYNTHFQYRWASNESLTKWYGVQRPLPFKFWYQVDVWARLLRDLDDLGTQLALRQRADEVYLPVSRPVLPTPDLKGVSEFLSLMLFRGVVETSQLEPGRDQRVLRRSYSYVVNGWKDFDAEEYGIVETVRTDIWDTDDYEEGTDLLDTVIVQGQITDLEE